MKRTEKRNLKEYKKKLQKLIAELESKRYKKEVA